MLLSQAISCMISYKKLWYHVWYQYLAFFYPDIVKKYGIIFDIIFDIIYDITMSVVGFLAFFLVWFCIWFSAMSPLLLITYYLTHDFSHDMTLRNFWCHSHVNTQILWYVSLLVYHGTCARVGGARRQTFHLLRPRHCQRAGDGCLAERLRPWWTCCSCCCHSQPLQVYNFKFQVQGGKFQVGRNFKFELMNRNPSLAHMQSCSPSWRLSSCRLAAFSSELGHWQSLRSARESARQTWIHCQSDSGCSAWLPLRPTVTDRQLYVQVLWAWACARLCTGAYNGDTTPYGAIANNM